MIHICDICKKKALLVEIMIIDENERINKKSQNVHS